MKTISILFSIILIYIFTSCEEDKWKFVFIESVNQINACGVDDPLNDLKWLHNLILESINKPIYVERIWVKRNDNEEIFVLQYALTSIMYYCYNCRGERLINYDHSIVSDIDMNILPYLDPDMIYFGVK